MHKFPIEIEIPDKDYCNGCKALQSYELNEKFTDFACGNGYFRAELKAVPRMTRPDICKQNDKLNNLKK